MQASTSMEATMSTTPMGWKSGEVLASAAMKTKMPITKIKTAAQSRALYLFPDHPHINVRFELYTPTRQFQGDTAEE